MVESWAVPIALALALLAGAGRAQDEPAPVTSEEERWLDVGATVRGVLGPEDATLAGPGSAQRFVLALEGGPVTIALESFDFDATLRVESAAGEVLAEDDDSGVETDAWLVLEAPGEEVCSVVVASKGGGGEFALSAAAGRAAPPGADVQSEAGIRWRATAAERALARGDARAAAAHRVREGSLRLARSQLHGAKAAFETALALSLELGDRSVEAVTRANLGFVLHALGDAASARECYELSLAVTRELGMRAEEVAALGALGNLQSSVGDFAGALELYRESLELARALGDRTSEGMLLGNLGLAHNALGDFAAAREHHEQHLALARALGDRAQEATALGDLGFTLYSLGEFARARECNELELAQWRALGDRAGEATALASLGIVLDALGDLVRAQELHEQSLSLAREFGDRRAEEKVLANLGNVVYALGDFARARELYEQRLALVRALGDRVGQATALESLGKVHESLGELDLARAQLEQSLALARELGDRLGEAVALGNLGSVLRGLGDLDGAREHHAQHLALARELGDRYGEATALAKLAGDARELGEVDLALELAGEAEALARELGTPNVRLAALELQAAAAIDAGDARRALAALEEGERALAELSAGGLAPGDAARLRGRHTDLGRLAQDSSWLRARSADGSERASALAWGLAASGRWKGRALLEGIAEHRAGARSAEAIELRRARRDALAAHGAALQRVAHAIQGGAPPEEVEAARAAARAQRAEAERLAERLRAVSPRDAALDLPLGARPAELQSALLGPRDLLVEYAEGEERLYAYVLGAGALELLDLGSQAEAIVELASFLELVRDPRAASGAAEIGRAGRALFDRLLGPALAQAETPVERLVIVPSAALAALPFEALVTGGAEPSFEELEFVLDRYELTYGPSAPVLVELASIGPRAGPGRLLVLADPMYAAEAGGTEGAELALAFASPRALAGSAPLQRLPGTRAEALAIALRLAGADRAELGELRELRSGSLAGARFDLHLGRASSRARLAGDLRGYAILHLACHGHVDAEFPQRTGIALSASDVDDGYFTIGDALELDLDAELVVLSACETAQGRALAGEGIESLARAFLYAGARGVVASQWQVADQAAAETMERFYRGMLEDGLSPARALHRAKLALRRGETPGAPSPSRLGVPISADSPQIGAPSAHPFFWAPFVHVGLLR